MVTVEAGLYLGGISEGSPHVGKQSSHLSSELRGLSAPRMEREGELLCGCIYLKR